MNLLESLTKGWPPDDFHRVMLGVNGSDYHRAMDTVEQ